jgi:glyoxylase-like metal-dependent hydrolase (beta-lactamase superfamily II)
MYTDTMSQITRRDFLESAGALSAASESAAPSSAPGASAEAGAGLELKAQPQRISDHLYLLEDTCNVYLIRDGTACLLIDFGSGKMLDYLADLGVSQVEWILHTHHHRDQCQGDWKAVQRGIPIAVPQHERHLFADAQNLWRNRRVFHLYILRNEFNTITQNIPVARSLQDYSTFRWRGIEFFVFPTPGHTLGSITLLARIDGRQVAFSGDLMYAPGKIQNLYDTQINYGGSDGIDLGHYSLARLREQKPELLCPSHGTPLADPDRGMQETMARLAEYYRFQYGEPSEFNRPIAVSPHLVAHAQTQSSFYAIISDSGKAMFIDYGSPSGNHFWKFEDAAATTDRMRFVEHSIAELKRNFGLKSVDVAVPSHMHDDHINGFPHLIRHYGTRIWCYENMVDILQTPRGYNLGCILGEPVKVSRSLRNGERFRWEEFEFEVTHSPGHTEYQMAMYATIDGKRVGFTGDAFFANPRDDGTLRHNLIFRNHVENDSHLKSIRNLIEHEPALVCPGHGKPYPASRQMLEATEAKLRRQQRFFFDLLPEGEVDFGLDPSWVSVYPYQILAIPGEPQRLEIRVQNYQAAPMKMEIALIAPPEWSIEPGVLNFEVPARSRSAAAVQVRIPRGWTAPGPRFAIAADVMSNGRYLGQIAEAIVEMPST